MVEVLEALAELREGGLVFSFFPGVVCLWGAGVVGGVNWIYAHRRSGFPQARRGQRASGEAIGKYDVCNFMAA